MKHSMLTWRYERRRMDMLLRRRSLGHTYFRQCVWGRTEKKVQQRHAMNIIVDPICNVANKIGVYTWVSATMCFQITIVPRMSQPRLFGVYGRVPTRFTWWLLDKESGRKTKEYQVIVRSFVKQPLQQLNHTFAISTISLASKCNEC